MNAESPLSGDYELPQVIGLDATDYRNEWGMFVDRRSSGLGITLLVTCGSLASAERDAANAEGTYPTYPLLIAKRTVTRSPWINVEQFYPPGSTTTGDA